jgi:hypothetical protein
MRSGQQRLLFRSSAGRRRWLPLLFALLLLFAGFACLGTTILAAQSGCQDLNALYHQRDALREEYRSWCVPASNETQTSTRDNRCFALFQKWQQVQDDLDRCARSRLSPETVIYAQSPTFQLLQRKCFTRTSPGEREMFCWDPAQEEPTLELLQKLYRYKGCEERASSSECSHLQALTRELAKFFERDLETPSPTSIQPTTSSPPASAARQLSGIDFASIRLSYIAEAPDASQPPIQVFSAALGPETFEAARARQAIALPQAAFGARLVLPRSAFWVNLHPSEPSRIADAQLSRTDVARVMLEADLQLKRDTARITDPRSSPVGPEFWKRILEAAAVEGNQIQIEAHNRVWVVPGSVVLASDGERVWLKEAGLNVMLEAKYFEARGHTVQVRGGAGAQERRARQQAIFERMVLPTLQEWVNTAPQYAALRQVFASLALAEWWRSRHGEDAARARFGFKRGELTGMLSPAPWSPEAIWKDYLKSLKEGEYDFTEERRDTVGDKIIIERTRYFSGGVDFVTVPAPKPEREARPMPSALDKAISDGCVASWDGRLWFTERALSGTPALCLEPTSASP